MSTRLALDSYRQTTFIIQRLEEISLVAHKLLSVGHDRIKNVSNSGTIIRNSFTRTSCPSSSDDVLDYESLVKERQLFVYYSCLSML